MWSGIINIMLTYIDYVTLNPVIPFSSVRQIGAVGLNEELNKTEPLCSQWTMRLNPNKSKALIVSPFTTLFPQHYSLFVFGVYIHFFHHLLSVIFDFIT